MKRLVALVLIAVLFASPAMAAWTLKVSTVSYAKNYVVWKVVCTSDGNALSSTDLIGRMTDQKLKDLVIGSTAMIMTVSPGSGGVAPDTTINVTLSDGHRDYFVDTGISNTADSFNDLSQDFNAYLPVYPLFKLALNDIGTSGDQVTLYFDCWRE